MKEHVKLLIKHPIVAGSSVIFLGSFGANFINYLFNLSMGRMLSVADYGLLTSLNSLFILIGIFSVSFGGVVTKFSAKYYSSDDLSSAAALVRYTGKFVLIFSSVLTLILLMLTPQIAFFLHINNYLYIDLVLGALFFSLVLSIPAGFIQGRLQFLLLSFVTLIQPALRIGIALILLFLGFSVLGPIIAIALSTAIPAVGLYFYLLKRYSGSALGDMKADSTFKKEFLHYTYTYFLSGIGLSLLSNTDIILVRHFFDAQTAGQYAALSLMGKVIFYFTAPVTIVFFPIIAYKKERKERLLGTVLLASGVVVGVSVLMALFYFAFPQIVLNVFFPKVGYQVLTHYLGYYSLYILVFSFAALLNSYFLSIGKTKVYVITLIGAFIQIISISLFHASIYEIIIGLFSSSFVMLSLFLIYYYLHGED